MDLCAEVQMGIMEGEGMKVCKVCKQNKRHSEFHKSNSTTDGLQYKCKLCQRIYGYKKLYGNRKVVSETCRIITNHSKKMQSDPEHLTTEFVQKIIGRKCD